METVLSIFHSGLSSFLLTKPGGDLSQLFTLRINLGGSWSKNPQKFGGLLEVHFPGWSTLRLQSNSSKLPFNSSFQFIALVASASDKQILVIIYRFTCVSGFWGVWSVLHLSPLMGPRRVIDFFSASSVFFFFSLPCNNNR